MKKLFGILLVGLFLALPLMGDWYWNKYTGKLDYYAGGSASPFQSLYLWDTNQSNKLIMSWYENDVANRNFYILVNGGNRTINLSGDFTLSGSNQVANWRVTNALVLNNYEIINPYAPKVNIYKGQIHCHTTNSDGMQTPAVMAAAYLAAGYNFLAITDHDFLTPDTGTPGLLYIPGIEENTNEGDALNLGATANVIPITPAQVVVDGIIAQGAIPLLAHPGYYAIPWTKHQLDRLNGFVGLSIYDYETSSYAGGPTYENLWDYLLSEGKCVVGHAEDDAHNLASVNKGWIYVFADSATAANIIDSIHKGNFYSSTGPTMTIFTTSMDFTVTTPAAATIDFIGKGGTVLQTSAAVTTATYTFTGFEMYVRARITRDSDNKMAWSNPVYIKRDFVISEPQGQRVYGNSDVVNGILTANQYSLNLITMAAPGAPTAALGATAGIVTAGNHTFKMTFVMPVGETSLGTASGVVAADGSHVIELTNLPVDSTGFAISKNLYMTAAGGTNYFFAGTISNIQTSYTFNLADASLGTTAMNSAFNYSGGRIFKDGVLCGFIGTTSATTLGYRAGNVNVDGGLTAFGYNAGILNTTGDATIFGSSAGIKNTTGLLCAFGYQAGASSISAGLCAFGYKAGYYSTGTSALFGYKAGYYITSGNLIALGPQAGFGTSTANAPATDTYGILIGYNANRSVPTATALTNYVGIGYATLIDKSNQVKIGNTSIVETQLYGSILGYTGGDSDFDIDEVLVSTLDNTIGGTIMVFETTGNVVAIYRIEGGTLTIISVNAAYSTTKDNAGTYNIYYETNIIKIQNKVGNNKAIKYRFDGIGS